MAAGMSHPDMVGHVAAAAERALEESRRAIDTFSNGGPTPLEEALRNAGQQVAERAGAEVDLHVEPGLTVAPVVAEALARVVREAVGNAVRHGEARCVAVNVGCHNRGLRLQVTDDGRGFQPEDVRHGFGLKSMRERVEALGGQLHVRSQPGKGTTIEAVVPTSPFSRAPQRRPSKSRS